MITIESGPGSYISTVCQKAVALAHKHNEPVEFTFNDTPVVAHPGELAQDVEARWQRDFTAAAEAYRNSDEYKERERKRKEEYRQKCAASMKEAAQAEEQMREASVPWPYTMEQLVEYTNSLVDRQHDYGTCVYAVSMAATAAFYYVSHKLGVTGFQASCADLDILRRTRLMKGPFILLKAEDALYPQYDLRGRLDEALRGWLPWLAEQAEKKLAEGRDAHPDVLAHWEMLAAQKKEESDGGTKL